MTLELVRALSDVLANIARNSRAPKLHLNEIIRLRLVLVLPNKSSSEETIDIQNTSLNEARGDNLRP